MPVLQPRQRQKSVVGPVFRKRAAVSKYRKSGARSKNSKFFFISQKKTLLVLKLFSSLDRPKRGRRPKGNYAN